MSGNCISPGTEALLPCPFCSGADVGFGRTGQKWQTVACNECGAEGPCTEIDRDLIIEKWNTRNAGVAATAGSAGAMREALEAALPYLDNSDSPGGCNGKHAGCGHCAAIAKVRAALAAPQPQEGEPVAWAPFHEKRGFDFRKTRATREAVVALIGLDPMTAKPLYTSDSRPMQLPQGEDK